MALQVQLDTHSDQPTQKVMKVFKKSKNRLFAVAVFGQWFFVLYIVLFFGGAWISGDQATVNEQLFHGFEEGDVLGNFALGLHLFLAAVIMFGGPIQFFPSIRNRFPTFHRWNGRMYFVTAFLISLAGLYMLYTKGAAGSEFTRMGNTLNAFCIMWFSAMAWRMAMKRDFVSHKKWALRTFLAVSGVWFFRMGYGIWMIVTGFTMPGSNNNLTGSFDVFLSFGHAIIPLLILELYFYVKRQNSSMLMARMTYFLYFLTVLLVLGLAMVIAFFWMPHMV